MWLSRQEGSKLQLAYYLATGVLMEKEYILPGACNDDEVLPSRLLCALTSPRSSRRP
jgi:hypothetical protein